MAAIYRHSHTVQPDEIPALKTRWGPLRVVTPTLCVMDRLAAFWHWHDRQAWDQAVMVAAERRVDFCEVTAFASEEGRDPADVERLRKEARIGRARKRR